MLEMDRVLRSEADTLSVEAGSRQGFWIGDGVGLRLFTLLLLCGVGLVFAGSWMAGVFVGWRGFFTKTISGMWFLGFLA